METLISTALDYLKGEYGGILALFGLLGGVGGYWVAQQTILKVAAEEIRHLKELREEKKTFTSVLPDMHDVYAHLNEVMVRLGGNRCLVMYTENGGGRPTIGSQLYASIVYEVYTHQCGSIRKQIQRKQVDESYVKMLGYMVSNVEKRTNVVTAQMPPCMLRDIYERSGVKMSFVYLIKETESRLYYASFNFPHDILDPSLIYECDIKANQIAQLFKHME